MPLVHSSMFAPRMPTSCAVFSPSPPDERLVVEVVHAAARFHHERVAPRPRVVDAGAVGGVGADAGEAVAGWAALLRAAERAELRRVGQLRTQLLQHQTTSLPLLDWRVTFPASAQDVTLQPDATSTLAPGSYRNITINARATLTLSAGTYFFDSLDIEAQGKVIANRRAAPDRLREAPGHLARRSRGQRRPPAAGGLLRHPRRHRRAGVHGDPHRPVGARDTGSSPATAFTGRFLADRLEVRPDAVIRRP